MHKEKISALHHHVALMQIVVLVKQLVMVLLPMRSILMILHYMREEGYMMIKNVSTNKHLENPLYYQVPSNFRTSIQSCLAYRQALVAL